MERHCKRIFGKRNLIFVFIFLILAGSFVSSSYGEEEGKTKWGFSILARTNAKSRPDLTLLAILPKVGLALHENWDFELEGNFSYYAIKDQKNLYLLGTNANILFKPVQWVKGALFLIGGAGLGYNNNNGKVREIGDLHVAGILQGGTGICITIGKGWLLRGEYRFQHISDPFEKDVGINTHNFILGVSF